MIALTIHATKPLPASLLATLKRANIDLRSVSSKVDDTGGADDFSHLHNLTAEQEEKAFREATRINQQRFWNRNSHLI